MATTAEIRSFVQNVRKEIDRRNALKFAALTDFTPVQSKVAGIESGAQVNIIESVKVNGTALTVTNKAVNLDLSGYVTGSDVASGLRYKGSVNAFANLPNDAANGDMYNVKAAGGSDIDGHAVKAGDNVVWNGSGWDVLAGTIDLSAYDAAIGALSAAVNTSFTQADLEYIFSDE